MYQIELILFDRTNTHKKLQTHLKKAHAGPASSIPPEPLSTNVEPSYAGQLPPGQLPLPKPEESNGQLFTFPQGSGDNHEQPRDRQMLPFAPSTFAPPAVPQNNRPYPTFLSNANSNVAGNVSAPFMWSSSIASVPAIPQSFVQAGANEFSMQPQNVNQVSAPLIWMNRVSPNQCDVRG